MNETELLARLREEIPLEAASPEAERLFMAGVKDALSGPGTMRRRDQLDSQVRVLPEQAARGLTPAQGTFGP